MTELYNKFRFSRKHLFHSGNEKSLKFVFEQVSFFLEYHPDGSFSNSELSESVSAAAKSKGIIIPDEMKLIQLVMDFFCDELGLKTTFRDYYPEIYGIVSEIILKNTAEGWKFIDPLTRNLVDVFNTADYSTTMDEVVDRLKQMPMFRFLPYSLLDETVNSVYEYFAGLASDEF